MRKLNQLSRAEMRNVLGGVAQGSCAVQGDDGETWHGYSAADAQATAAAMGTHWCCDSCSKASWYCPTGEYCNTAS